MAGTTKDRILETTAELFRRQGFSGTGLKQIAESARAPFGSLYHHFPGGKEQLTDDVIRWSGSMYLELFQAVVAEIPDPAAGMRAFFDGAAETLLETDYADACPIATVALEVASTNEVLRVATAEVFDSWVSALITYFMAGGVTRRRAGELAFSILSLLEGAFILCRSMRTTEPLHVAGRDASDLVAAARPTRRKATSSSGRKRSSTSRS